MGGDCQSNAARHELCCRHCFGEFIATNDDNLAEKIRMMINFGFTGLDSVRHLGTNGKMSEIHAAMGLSCF